MIVTLLATMALHSVNHDFRAPLVALGGRCRALSSNLADAVTAPAETPVLQTPLRLRHCLGLANGELQPVRIRERGRDVYALRGRDFCAGGVCSEEDVCLGDAANWDRARVGFLFSLWYALSIVYSVKNKQAHMALALPLTIATAQVLVGACVAFVVWAARVRQPPRMTAAAFRTLIPIGVFHGLGHLTGVFATAVGSVSFVQVVKSAGPAWACLCSALFLRQPVSRRITLSLVPIIAGVALASAKELEFVWAAFVGAAASDVALALRNVFSKKSMDTKRPQAQNMNAQNSFYVFTCLACLFCLPLTLLLEGPLAAAAWRAAAPTPAAAAALAQLIAASGLYFTLYSEVQFLALDRISPVTHAVGNTMRRVAIMVVCIAVFGTPVSVLGGIGSALAVGGTYTYAMATTYEQQEEEASLRKKAEETGTALAAPTGRADHPLLPLLKLVGQAHKSWRGLAKAGRMQ
jgi:solute carrier family 35, member E1